MSSLTFGHFTKGETKIETMVTVVFRLASSELVFLRIMKILFRYFFFPLNELPLPVQTLCVRQT